MINQSDLQYLNGADVYTAHGGKIGSAGRVYLDDRTGEPEWISVRTGLFGTEESLVPLDRATLTDDRLEVPFDKDRVKDAPRIDADGDLSVVDEDKLYTYYGLGSVRDHDRSTTRAEQRWLISGSRPTQSRTVRLRTYAVTEPTVRGDETSLRPGLTTRP